jgi:hypothetical protein
MVFSRSSNHRHGHSIFSSTRANRLAIGSVNVARGEAKQTRFSPLVLTTTKAGRAYYVDVQEIQESVVQWRKFCGD